MTSKRARTGVGRGEAREPGRAQLVALEAALASIALIAPAGLNPVEATQAEGLRQAALRLVAIGEQVAVDGLTVEGSMGQKRLHPLLVEERALRREIAERLAKLELRVTQRAQFERVRDLTREPLPEFGLD